MTIIFLLMFVSIIWLFIDNHYSKQRIDLLRDRVKDLEFHIFPKNMR